MQDDVSRDGFEGEELDFFRGGIEGVVGEDGSGLGFGRGGEEEWAEGGFGSGLGWGGGGGGFDLVAHLKSRKIGFSSVKVKRKEGKDGMNRVRSQTSLVVRPSERDLEAIVLLGILTCFLKRREDVDSLLKRDNVSERDPKYSKNRE